MRGQGLPTAPIFRSSGEIVSLGCNEVPKVPTGAGILMISETLLLVLIPTKKRNANWL